MFSGMHLKVDAWRLRVRALIDRERAAVLPLVALPHLAVHRPDGMFHANPKSMKSDRGFLTLGNHPFFGGVAARTGDTRLPQQKGVRAMKWIILLAPLLLPISAAYASDTDTEEACRQKFG
jgi:hypothetical protein